MITEELEFSLLNQDNKVVTCKILSLNPKNDVESYVVYTDGEMDENDNIVFKYGLLIKKDDDFELTTGVTAEELNYIKELFYEDILELAKELKDGTR